MARAQKAKTQLTSEARTILCVRKRRRLTSHAVMRRRSKGRVRVRVRVSVRVGVRVI